jgi:hypothetical protein
MASLGVLKEQVQRSGLRRCQMLADQGDQPALLRQQGLAHRLLEKAVTGSHETMFGQVVPEFPEHIDWFAANSGCLLGFGRQTPPFFGITGSVIAKHQDDALLFKERDLNNFPIFRKYGIKCLSLEYNDQSGVRHGCLYTEYRTDDEASLRLAG